MTISSAILIASTLLTIIQGMFGFATHYTMPTTSSLQNTVHASAIQSVPTTNTVTNASPDREYPITTTRPCEIRKVSASVDGDGWVGELTLGGLIYAVYGYSTSPFEGSCELESIYYGYRTSYTIVESKARFPMYFF